MIFGMFCGFIYVNLKRLNLIKDTENDGNVLPSTKYTIATMVVALCALLVSFYDFTARGEQF